MIKLQENELIKLLSTAAEMGANTALRDSGLSKPQITKADAYRRYSRKRVDKWIEDRLVLPVHFGSSIFINVKELESASLHKTLYSEMSEI